MYVSSNATALPTALQGTKFNISSVPGVSAPSFLSQITGGIQKVFTQKNIDTAVALGATYTTMKYGGAKATPPGETQSSVGAKNPPPGDWLSRVYENLGQPNNTSSIIPTFGVGGTNFLMIAIVIFVGFMLLMRR